MSPLMSIGEVANLPHRHEMKREKNFVELKAKFDDSEIQRFRACVCSRELATGEKLTHQAAVAEAVREWMDRTEERYGRVIVERASELKSKHG